MEKLGKIIKELRSKAGLTQEQAAKQINVGRSTYTKYELGSITPSVEVLQKMADMFHVPIYDFFQDFLDISMSEADYFSLDDQRKVMFWARSCSAETMDHLIDMAETLSGGSSWQEYIEGNAYSLGLLPAGDGMSKRETTLLAAYHAAPAEIRAIVDTALEPYKAGRSADSAAS